MKPGVHTGVEAAVLALRSAQNRGFEQHAVDLVDDREAWLAMRERDVTASVAGAIFGVHDYRTHYELWALKLGLISDEVEESKAMRRGRLLEPVALQMLREERPAWVISPCATYFRDASARIGATPDALAIDPERPGFGIVQFKSVESSIFRRKWRNEDGSIEPPLWIAVQALVEAELTGASWAAVAPLVVGFGVEMPVIDIPLNPSVIAQFRKRVAEFWERVETHEPPPADYARDGETLARLYAQDDGTTIDLSGDNALPELGAEDRRLAEEIKERTERRKAIKAEVLAKLGPAAVATINNRVFATAKTLHRKEYTVKPTTYRDLRIKDIGEAA